MPICRECAYFESDMVDYEHGICVVDVFFSETSGESRYSIRGERVLAKQECTKPEKFVPKSKMDRRERLWKSH